jgi:sugar O-acyltransferase (sialic acid O-acetyltransferase NeuD family)
MKDIAIFGAGGFGKEIACIINQINKEKPVWNLIGYFDDGIEKNTFNGYGIVLGGVEDLNLWRTPLSVIIAIGNPKTLRMVVEKIKNPAISFPNIIAPNVYLMDVDSLQMGQGNVICPNSIISCNVKMGNFNLFNVQTQVGHDSELGNYNIIMPSVNISGGIKIGNCNLFGVKSTILQYKTIGNEVTVTPGSVMTRNGKDGRMYLGNPAKILM